MICTTHLQMPLLLSFIYTIWLAFFAYCLALLHNLFLLPFILLVPYNCATFIVDYMIMFAYYSEQWRSSDLCVCVSVLSMSVIYNAWSQSRLTHISHKWRDRYRKREEEEREREIERQLFFCIQAANAFLFYNFLLTQVDEMVITVYGMQISCFAYHLLLTHYISVAQFTLQKHKIHPLSTLHTRFVCVWARFELSLLFFRIKCDSLSYPSFDLILLWQNHVRPIILMLSPLIDISHNLKYFVCWLKRQWFVEYV